MKVKRWRYRILCVADSVFGLQTLQEALQGSGYDVLLAFTADHAVAATIGDKFDAIILEAELIRKQGSAAAAALKLARPDVPVLLLNHRQDPARVDELPKGVDLGVAGRSPDAVISALGLLLSQRRTAAANSK